MTAAALISAGGMIAIATDWHPRLSNQVGSVVDTSVLTPTRSATTAKGCP